MNELKLKVAGLEYSGWESIRVSRSLEALAGLFEISVSNRTRERQLRLPSAGESCQVMIGAVPVVTGYIDQVTQEGTADSHTITVAGRDKTADLVDCSVMRPQQWKGLKSSKLLSELLLPYGIELVHADVWSCERWSVHPGEGVFDAIERLVQTAGLLAYTDGAGRLVVGRSGSKRADTDLEVGINVLTWEETNDWQERFSEIKVLGQHDGDSSPSLSASELDHMVTRRRPLVVMADGSATKSAVRRRAKWEQTTRRGKSRAVNVTVQGWFDAGDAIWEINRLVRYCNPATGADETLLIAGVEFSLDGENGTTTSLRLVGKSAFDVEGA